MNRMHTAIVTVAVAGMIVTAATAATTITYSYDGQHRLVQADYSASRKVQYGYDAAGNLDMEVAITDAQYLRSFLLFLARRGLQEGAERVVQALHRKAAEIWECAS